MAALFYKAPFIGELAAEGGLRGCFLFSGRLFFFRETASNLSVSCADSSPMRGARGDLRSFKY